LAWVGYSAASCSAVKGTVWPNRTQFAEAGGAPGAALLPVPLSFAIGVSTYGVRMPPVVLPFASSENTTGVVPGAEVASRRGAIGGGVPFLVQRLIQCTVASNTQCIGPVLIPSAHSRSPGCGAVGGFCMNARFWISPCPSPTSVRPTTRPYWSKCAVPATSQSRNLPVSVSVWRASSREFATSSSDWNTITGVVLSSRIAARGTVIDGSGDWLSAAP